MTTRDFRAFLLRKRGVVVTTVIVLFLFIGGVVYAQTPSGSETLRNLITNHADTADAADPSDSRELEATTASTTKNTTAATTTAATTKATTAATTTAATTKATTEATTTATTQATTAAPTSGSVVLYPDMAAQVLALVNEQRALEVNGSLPPLSASSSLNDTATVRVQEIVVSFSHTRPNGEASYTAFTGSWSYMGENIAMGYASAESVVAGWMASEGHRANILRAEFTYMGIACCFDGETYYWAQEFGA